MDTPPASFMERNSGVRGGGYGLGGYANGVFQGSK